MFLLSKGLYINMLYILLLVFDQTFSEKVKPVQGVYNNGKIYN